jgi:hypothetical protein
LQIENDKAASGYEELKARLPQVERDLKKSDKDRMTAQAQVQDLLAQLHNGEQLMNQLRDENEV